MTRLQKVIECRPLTSPDRPQGLETCTRIQLTHNQQEHTQSTKKTKTIRNLARLGPRPFGFSHGLLGHLALTNAAPARSPRRPIVQTPWLDEPAAIRPSCSALGGAREPKTTPLSRTPATRCEGRRPAVCRCRQHAACMLFCATWSKSAATSPWVCTTSTGSLRLRQA